jgi:DNA-directed RNA polymerase II subunit RPB2
MEVLDPAIDEDEPTQEDIWAVISSYFNDKGLVRQQLDSFDEFIMNTMQEAVDESVPVTFVKELLPGEGVDGELQRRVSLKFNQIYLSKPTMTESDGQVNPLFPQEARLRNLTYSAPLYVDMKKSTHSLRRENAGEVEEDPAWVPVEDEQDVSKVFIGRVPIMLRSNYCILSNLNDKELYEVGEDPLDMVCIF